MIVNNDLQNLLISNSLFKGVQKEQIKSYLKPKNYFTANEGTMIYSNGEKATDIYLVVQGEVKIKFSESREVKYKYLSDFFGESEIRNENKRVSTAIANKDSILYKMSSDELKSLTKIHKKIEENLLTHDYIVIPEELQIPNIISEENIIPTENTDEAVNDLESDPELEFNDNPPELTDEELDQIMERMKNKS